MGGERERVGVMKGWRGGLFFGGGGGREGGGGGEREWFLWLGCVWGLGGGGGGGCVFWESLLGVKGGRGLSSIRQSTAKRKPFWQWHQAARPLNSEQQRLQPVRHVTSKGGS